jgi:hypothetical protein
MRDIHSYLAWNLKTRVSMSKNNNVNPGQYKVGGRLHPGDDSSKQQQDKAEAALEEQRLREDARGSHERAKKE